MTHEMAMHTGLLTVNAAMPKANIGKAGSRPGKAKSLIGKAWPSLGKAWPSLVIIRWFVIMDAVGTARKKVINSPIDTLAVPY